LLRIQKDTCSSIDLQAVTGVCACASASSSHVTAPNFSYSEDGTITVFLLYYLLLAVTGW
jgi:hypothetical protein